MRFILQGGPLDGKVIYLDPDLYGKPIRLRRHESALPTNVKLGSPECMTIQTVVYLPIEKRAGMPGNHWIEYHAET